MLEYIRRQRRAWLRLREVRREERLITSLIAEHSYNLRAPYAALGIPIIKDDTMEDGAVLYFTPARKGSPSPADAPLATVQLHPKAAVVDQRMALGMLLIHLSITHADTLYASLPPYIVYASDLEAPEGPSHNQQWVEYMQAMDLLLPAAAFQMLGRLFPTNPAYAMQRVMGVSAKTVMDRAKCISRGLGPILPRNFLPTKQCTAR